MDRGAWQATFHGVTESDMTDTHTHTHTHTHLHTFVPGVQEFYTRMYAIFYGEGNGNPLQYSCLVNPMDGGAW